MPRRVLSGVVVSAKCDKTISVKVERLYRHPLYGKTVRRSRKYSAHNEDNSVKEGDVVLIQECRPISKTKSWIVIKE